MTVRLVVLCVCALALANPRDPTEIENFTDQKFNNYQLDVAGKEPITIIDTSSSRVVNQKEIKRKDLTSASARERDDVELKHIMTDIIHDPSIDRPRCYGPSCHEGFNSDDSFIEYVQDNSDKIKDYSDLSKDRIQAISALAAKLKKEKLKADRYSPVHSEDIDNNDNGKVFTSWNRLKVKHHKHPYDDKDGWVTLEPVAWSTSKISKWKPNVKKQKPNQWNDDANRFPDDDRYNSYNEDSYNYPQKRPSMSRPAYINNKLHSPSDYELDAPSRPSFNKPHNSYHYPDSWSSDEGKRPYKPHCDIEEAYPSDDSVYYGMSDSVVTDNRPSNFPYEYEALHQSSSHKRPLRRPPQVVYSGSLDYDNDRVSRPPHGDGQWVLLSTTKGYRNKKRQRSLAPPADDISVPSSVTSSVTSHQAVALTVLPVDSSHTNMTTSHGGLLEVERSFQTVEESKRDMDKRHDLDTSSSQSKPYVNKVMKRKILSNVSPDSSTVLAAVGAGMLPATMAMVVPMMLGRRRRRRDVGGNLEGLELSDEDFRYQ